ncbi:MAG: hypothetical protein HRT61_10100 [Ekhidna sp.]|nr:hypothetical protein [Ekhidna sp.]
MAVADESKSDLWNFKNCNAVNNAKQTQRNNHCDFYWEFECLYYGGLTESLEVDYPYGTRINSNLYSDGTGLILNSTVRQTTLK